MVIQARTEDLRLPQRDPGQERRPSTAAPAAAGRGCGWDGTARRALVARGVGRPGQGGAERAPVRTRAARDARRARVARPGASGHGHIRYSAYVPRVPRVPSLERPVACGLRRAGARGTRGHRSATSTSRGGAREMSTWAGGHGRVGRRARGRWYRVWARVRSLGELTHPRFVTPSCRVGSNL